NSRPGACTQIDTVGDGSLAGDGCGVSEGAAVAVGVSVRVNRATGSTAGVALGVAGAPATSAACALMLSSEVAVCVTLPAPPSGKPLPNTVHRPPAATESTNTSAAPTAIKP